MRDVFKLSEEYTITKNIAKHGRNSIIVIPHVLREQLQPRTTVKVTIEVIKRPKDMISPEEVLKDD